MYYCKEIVKTLKCYLIPKKVMALCLKVQIFWPTLYIYTVYHYTLKPALALVLM